MKNNVILLLLISIFQTISALDSGADILRHETNIRITDSGYVIKETMLIKKTRDELNSDMSLFTYYPQWENINMENLRLYHSLGDGVAPASSPEALILEKELEGSSFMRREVVLDLALMDKDSVVSLDFIITGPRDSFFSRDIRMGGIYRSYSRKLTVSMEGDERLVTETAGDWAMFENRRHIGDGRVSLDWSCSMVPPMSAKENPGAGL